MKASMGSGFASLGKHKAEALIVTFCVGLCWLWLSSDPPWSTVVGEFTDEAFYTVNVQSYLKMGKWRLNWLDQTWSTPLYQLLLLGASYVAGIRYATVKALSALFASATLLSMYAFCRRRFGARHAILSLLFLSFNATFFSVRRTFGCEAVLTAFVAAGYFLLTFENKRAWLAAGALLALAQGVKLSACDAAPGAAFFLLWSLARRYAYPRWRWKELISG